MLASTSLISCNFSSFPRNLNPNNNSLISSQYPNPSISSSYSSSSSSLSPPKPLNFITKLYPLHKRTHLQICWNSINTQNSQDPISKKEAPLESENELDENGSEGEGGGGGGGEERDWTTSFLLFGLWVGLMYYVFNLTPNQTPSMDMYFLKKLLNLKGDDGFEMNEVLVSLWYIMGLWPLVYSMLLLPTARSPKGNVPVWPFVTLSFFGGAYVLLPYFVLWKPPPPPVEETELQKWPLNFLESKLTAGITVAAGLGLIVYAGLAGGDAWLEFYQYFRESKFIHVTSIDFSLLSTFAPFWVYNDMSVRKCDGKMGWLLPISLVPFLGPALYLLLRPSLSAMPVALSSAAPEEK